jgi:hypothetical protein
MTKTVSQTVSPAKFANALTVAADFFSNKQERMDSQTGEIRMVDLNGALVRNFLDTQCWKLDRMIGDQTRQLEEIGRRAQYYARSYGSRDIQDEDLEKVAQQLEDAQVRLATLEEGYRQACKVYQTVVGKPYMPKVPGIKPTEAETAVAKQELSPSQARLLASIAASKKVLA